MEPKPRNRGWTAEPGTQAWRGYVVAVAGTAAAALLRWAIGAWVGEIPPFITFYPVVMAAAMLGGTRAGLLATALCALAADLFFIPPAGRLWPMTPGYAAGLFLFAGINVIISLVGGRFRAAYGQSRLQAAALEAAANAIFVTDREGVIRWVNPAFELLTGYGAAEAVRKNPRLLKSGKHERDFYKQMWETVQGGRVWRGELVNKRKNGSLYTQDMTITPVRDVRGIITHFIAVQQDVTGRKEADARLLAMSRSRAEDLAALERLHEVSLHFAPQEDLRSLMDVILDAALTILHASKGYIQLLDRASGELRIIAQSGFDEAFVEYFSQIGSGMAVCDAAIETKRSVIVEDITASPLFQSDARALQLKLAAGVRAVLCTPLSSRTGQLLGVVSVHFAAVHRPSERDLGVLDLLARQAADFIELKQAEEALRERNAELDAERAQWKGVVEGIADEVWTCDAQGHTSLMNLPAVTAMGLDEFERKELQEVLPDVEILTPDGLPRPAQDSPLMRSLRGEVVRGEEIMVNRRTGRRRWRHFSSAPIRSGAGGVTGAVAIVRDITEQKQMEEALAQSKQELEGLVAARTARLRETIHELESFSYSIVHDMRAPLRAMQSFAALAEQSCGGCARPDSMDYFRRIQTASTRLDMLITDALNYSKVLRQELRLAPVELGELLRGIVESYPNLQMPGVEIQIELEGLVVLGNEAALTQVFSNLLGNAVKFVAPGVKPRVRVRAEEVRLAEGGEQSREGAEWQAGVGAERPGPSARLDSASHSPHAAGAVVRVWVEDNGIGIPASGHQKIFDMFQRMHRQEEYPGTGIGLTIVRKAMERMGGRAGVESELGKGSRFWIELAKSSAGAGGSA